MAIRGEGGGGERRIGALESSPEDFTVGHFILAKNHTGFSGVFFFVPNPNDTPRIRSASDSCSDRSDVAPLPFDGRATPRYLRIFHERTVRLRSNASSLLPVKMIRSRY